MAQEMDSTLNFTLGPDANLLPELQGVLDGFIHGYDQGIPKHGIGALRWFTPENHSSAVLARDKIHASISQEVESQANVRTSPLGLVVNADGKMRPINDLSFPKKDLTIPSVNSFVNKSHFETTWDDFNIVTEFFRQNDGQFDLALFDWEKAYRQVPTRMDQWPFLMVQDLDGGLFIDTRITFGAVAGCGSFGIPADAWKRIMTHEFDVEKIFRWVDDNLFVKRSSKSFSIRDIVSRSLELGVQTNEEKCSDFSIEQKFIGFVWNGRDSTVRLPKPKLEQRITQIEVFLVPKAEFKYNDAEVLAGRLNHVSYLLPQLRAYLRGVYRWMNEWKKKMATRTVPADVISDLAFWRESLLNFEHTRLVQSCEEKELNWVGDASTGFGIGVLIGHRWCQFRMKETWREGTPSRGIAWLETVAIRLGVLMLIELHLVAKGTNCVVWTDNTVTQATLVSKKSKDAFVNDEWKIIQTLLITNQLDITPKRVASKDNRADALSRGIQKPHVKENRVWVDIPNDLVPFLFHA
ncbi:uncharacterized protein PGTG_22607 [Puccinia graminis f. sp. tritici CRL 75-36-700-3]|uniref:Reverse transcriptase domain-containing protein n=1 Tax=Puccinia graminis f. sp. tritici (strain CRL 75-36-700-3 / race SCCL) TaxID=418459 RepID=H6QV43_PUCGT|nr:uncharacterized protein PGTG_22607 [Puccinia graminis f. sp. tritici CRL 75-36-700-3]EHS62704.1 hypothetical protein PGTG_22607 [Puccinia graminis f. sp. tritici CRL 75-36-700-3]